MVLALLTNANLPAGIYRVSVLAYDDYGNESDWADSIVIDVKVIKPGKAINLKLVK
jgi:hypothetical protein